MADEQDLPQNDSPGDDFGGFLGRRLRSYQSGILGLGGLHDVPVSGAAAEHGVNVVNRSAEFAGSLQSLLSYRGVAANLAPPPVSRQFDSAPASTPGEAAPERSETEASSGPSPAGPIAFGSETWFSRMAQRIAATEQRQRETAPRVSGPSAAAIEAALGLSSPAVPPRGDGTVRRRSIVQEMSGAGVELGSLSESRESSGEVTPASPAAPTEPAPVAPAPSGSTAAALARAESVSESASDPKLGPALMQRRPRNRRSSTPAVDAPVQRTPDAPVPAPANRAAPSVASSEAPAPAATTPSPTPPASGAASEPAPVRRSVVAPSPASRREPPDEGREGVRRVVPQPPRPPSGASPALTPSPATPQSNEDAPPASFAADAVTAAENSSGETGAQDSAATEPPPTRVPASVPVQRREATAERPAEATPSPSTQSADTAAILAATAGPPPPARRQVEAPSSGAATVARATSAIPAPGTDGSTPVYLSSQPDEASPTGIPSQVNPAATAPSTAEPASTIRRQAVVSPPPAPVTPIADVTLTAESPTPAPTDTPPATGATSPVPDSADDREVPVATTSPESTSILRRQVEATPPAASIDTDVTPAPPSPERESTPGGDVAGVPASTVPRTTSPTTASAPLQRTAQSPVARLTPGSIGPASAASAPGDASASVADASAPATATSVQRQDASPNTPESRPVAFAETPPPASDTTPRELPPPTSSEVSSVTPVPVQRLAASSAEPVTEPSGPSASGAARVTPSDPVRPGIARDPAAPADDVSSAGVPFLSAARASATSPGSNEPPPQTPAAAELRRTVAAEPPPAQDSVPELPTASPSTSTQPPGANKTTSDGGTAAEPAPEATPAQQPPTAGALSSPVSASAAQRLAASLPASSGESPTPNRDLSSSAVAQPTSTLPAERFAGPMGEVQRVVAEPPANPAPVEPASLGYAPTPGLPGTPSAPPSGGETSAPAVAPTSSPTVAPRASTSATTSPTPPTPAPTVTRSPGAAAAAVQRLASDSTPPSAPTFAAESSPRTSEPRQVIAAANAPTPAESVNLTAPGLSGPTSTPVQRLATPASRPAADEVGALGTIQPTDAPPDATRTRTVPHISPASSEASAEIQRQAVADPPATAGNAPIAPVLPQPVRREEDRLLVASAATRERVVATPPASDVLRELAPPIAVGVTLPAPPVQRVFTPRALEPLPANFPAPSPATTLPSGPPPILRSAPPVEMPLAPAQRDVQRVDSPATGRVQSVAPQSNTPPAQEQANQPPDYDLIAEQVWPRIRKKIRIERERERGRPY